MENDIDMVIADQNMQHDLIDKLTRERDEAVEKAAEFEMAWFTEKQRCDEARAEVLALNSRLLELQEHHDVWRQRAGELAGQVEKMDLALRRITQQFPAEHTAHYIALAALTKPQEKTV